jgi:chromosomal replication initiation ATPase DnaA
MRNVLEHAVTRAFAIEREDFWGVTRGQPQVAFARQVGMYLAHVAFGLSLTEVGHLFARDRTTVAHACSIVEDRRDDRCFDRALELLESAVCLLRPAHVAVTTSPNAHSALSV